MHNTTHMLRNIDFINSLRPIKPIKNLTISAIFKKYISLCSHNKARLKNIGYRTMSGFFFIFFFTNLALPTSHILQIPQFRHLKCKTNREFIHIFDGIITCYKKETNNN